MIGGISSGALSAAAARFDRAATAASEATLPDAADSAGGITDAMVAMAAAQFAFSASLQAARVSNDMIGEMLASFD